MKKIFITTLFILSSLLPIAADEIEEMTEALKQSNIMLAEANERIEDLTLEKQNLRGYIDSLLLEIEKNTKLLREAKTRIEEDQKEIETLRETIRSLMESGVEVKTYTWEIGVFANWPLGGGVQLAYNLPWITKLGIIAGFDFTIEQQFPSVYAGVKINLD